jgi:hypothetical protein
MRIETALKRRNAAMMALRDLYSHAKHFGLTSAEINEQFNSRVLATLKGAPAWTRYYVQGARDQISHELYCDGSLVHGAFIGGAFYSTHSNRPDYYGKNGFGAAGFARATAKGSTGHYWSHNLKPYFVGNE